MPNGGPYSQATPASGGTAPNVTIVMFGVLPTLTTTAVDGARIGRETETLLLNLLGYAEQDESSDISDDKTSHRIKIDVHLTPRGTTRAS